MLLIGQSVKVDLSGLEMPGLIVGSGVQTTGVVDAINPAADEVTVLLDSISFDGQKLVTLPTEQVSDAAMAQAV